MRRKEIAAGLMLAAAAGLLVAAVAVAGPGGGGAGELVVHAAAPDAFGLQVGSPVKVHGVEVGAVTDVSLVHDPARPGAPVRIAMRVSEHGAGFLKEGTVARVERIQMGPGIPPFATPEIALVTAGERPLENGAVIEAVAPETIAESLASMAREIAAARGMLTDLGPLLADLGEITSAVARGQGMAGRMLTDHEMADSVATIVREAREASREVRALVRDARAVSSEAGPALGEVRRASEEGGRAMRAASAALEDLPSILAATERTLELAEALARDLRAASRYAPELARKVDASIEEANRLVDAAQRSILLRGALPERRRPRTEAEARPSADSYDVVGEPSEAPSRRAPALGVAP